MSTQLPITDGLVAYYSGPQDTEFISNLPYIASDESGNNKHGICYNGVAFNSTEDAYLFDGVNDYVEIGGFENSSLQGGFTIVAEIYPLGLGGSSFGRILDKTDSNTGASNNGISLAITTGNKLLFGCNGIYYSNNDAFTLNQKNFIVITVSNDSSLNMYNNGALVASPQTVSALSVITTSNPLRIGNSYIGSRGFNGQISNVQMFNRALSEQEILKLYDDYLNNVEPSITYGRLLYLPLSKKYSFGQRVTDLSGNGYHGTNTGAFPTTNNFNSKNKASKLSIGNSISLPFQSVVNYTDDFTVSFWYKKETTQTGHQFIFRSQTNATNLVGLQLYTQANTLVFFKKDTGAVIFTNRVIPLDTWQYITLIQRTGSLFVYVNGIVVSATGTGPGGILTGSDNSTMILAPGGLGINNIHDISIHNRALSPEEIKTLYYYTKNNIYGSDYSRPRVFQETFQNTLLASDLSIVNNNKLFDQSYNLFSNPITPILESGSTGGNTSTAQMQSNASPNGVNFDGVNDFIYVGANKFDVSDGAYTYTTWIKPTNLEFISTDVCLFSNYAFSHLGFYLGINSDKKLYVFNPTTENQQIYPTVLENNKYYFITVKVIIAEAGEVSISVNSSDFYLLFSGNTLEFATNDTVPTNIIPSASSSFETDGTGWWGALRGTFTWNSTTQDATFVCSSTVGSALIRRQTYLNFSTLYQVRFKAKSTNATNKISVSLIGTQASSTLAILSPNLTTEYQDYIFEGMTSDINSDIYINFGGANIGWTIGYDCTIDNIEVFEIQNVYRSFIGSYISSSQTFKTFPGSIFYVSLLNIGLTFEQMNEMYRYQRLSFPDVPNVVPKRVADKNLQGNISYPNHREDATSMVLWSPVDNSKMSERINDGLVLHMPMYGDVLDYSGNGNNGTLVNGPTYTTDRFDRNNRAVLFDGVNDYVTIPDVGPATWTEDFTISLWIYIPSTVTWNTSYLSNILGKGSFDRTLGIIRSTTENRVGIFCRGDNTSAIYSTIYSTINRNEWFHITGIMKNSTLLLYHNSTYIGTSDISTFTGVPNNSIYNIGRNLGFLGSNGNYFEGKISNVRIYNRALNPDEISYLYNLESKLINLKDNTKSGIYFDTPNYPILTSDFKSKADAALEFSSLENSKVQYEPIISDEVSISSLVKLNKLDQTNLWYHFPLRAQDTDFTDNKPIQALDKSGNENHGIVYGDLVMGTGVLGETNGSYQFDGVNDYVSGDYLNITSLDVSLSFYVYFPEVNINLSYPIFVNSILNNINTAIIIRKQETNKFAFAIAKSSSTIIQGAQFDFTPSINTWYHIVAIRKVDTYYLYVDNVSKTFIELAGNGFSSNNLKYFIATVTGATTRAINVNNLRIYSRAITPTEVTALYNGEEISSDGLVLHLPLNKAHSVGNKTLSRTTSATGTKYNLPLITKDHNNQLFKAYKFNGTNSYIDTGVLNGFNPSTQSLTITCWAKWVSGISGLIGNYSSGTNQRFFAGVVNSKWGLGIQGTTWDGSVTSISNQWVFIRIEINHLTLIAKLYVNEVLSQVINYTSFTTIGNLLIGQLSSYYWNGDIADFRIYNKVLNSSEVEAVRSNTDWILGQSMLSTSETGYGLWFDSIENKIVFQLKDKTIHEYNLSKVISDFTQWYNFIGTFDISAGLMNLYINGILEDSLSNVSLVNSFGNLSGIVGYWPMNGNANDESGYGNNGTVYGATLTTDRFGHDNQAYSFDGVNDYIDVGYPNYTLTTEMSVFVSVIELGSSLGVYIAKSNGGSLNKRAWQINNNSGQLTVLVSADGGVTNTKVYRSTSNTVMTSTTKFIGFTFNNNILKLYVDGVEITNITKALDGTVNSIFNNSDVPISIGCNYQDNAITNFTKSIINDIRIYNRELSSFEVSNIYNELTSRLSVSHLTLGMNGTIKDIRGYERFIEEDEAHRIYRKNYADNDSYSVRKLPSTDEYRIVDNSQVLGTMPVLNDCVCFYENGMIEKMKSNNQYTKLKVGIVTSVGASDLTIQTSGTVTLNDDYTGDSDEIYVTSNSSGLNLTDIREVPFYQDDTLVVLGKKASLDSFVFMPEFYIFGEQEPNFVNDEVVSNFNFNAENVSGNTVTNLANSSQNMTLYNSPTFGDGFIGRAIINPDSNAYGQFIKPTTSGDWTFTIIAKMYGMSTLPVGSQGYSTLIGCSNGNRLLITTGEGNFNALAQLGVGTHFTGITNVTNRDYVLYQYVHKRNESKSYWRVNAVDRSEFSGNVVLNTTQRIFIYDGINYVLNGEIDTVMIHHKAWTIEESRRYWKYCNSYKIAL